MSDTPSEFPPDDPALETRRLVAKRLAMAAGLVAVLLGGLVVFDHLATQEELEETKVFTGPVPVAPRKEATQPVTVAPPESNELIEPKPAQPAEVQPEGTKGLSAREALEEPVPQPDSAPASEGRRGQRREPAVKADKNGGKVPGVALTAPAQNTDNAKSATGVPPAVVSQQPQRGTSSIPDEAAIAAGAPKANLKESGPVKSPAPAVHEPSPAPSHADAPSREPAPAKALARPVSPTPVPAPPRLFSGFALQAGVFSSTKAAEELHAKLTLNGIPSTLETRVQVGPFKTRAEAEAAREKMQALGIDALLMAPTKAGKR